MYCRARPRGLFQIAYNRNHWPALELVLLLVVSQMTRNQAMAMVGHRTWMKRQDSCTGTTSTPEKCNGTIELLTSTNAFVFFVNICIFVHYYCFMDHGDRSSRKWLINTNRLYQKYGVHFNVLHVIKDKNTFKNTSIKTIQIILILLLMNTNLWNDGLSLSTHTHSFELCLSMAVRISSNSHMDLTWNVG